MSHINMVCVVGYGPFALCVIHKDGLCPSSGDINRLMIMIFKPYYTVPSNPKLRIACTTSIKQRIIT
jgi:hypothetical protein